jgi:hypothetical protein
MACQDKNHISVWIVLCKKEKEKKRVGLGEKYYEWQWQNGLLAKTIEVEHVQGQNT